MTASYDAVLFDLDGVLTSTAALRASVEYALDEGRVEASRAPWPGCAPAPREGPHRLVSSPTAGIQVGHFDERLRLLCCTASCGGRPRGRWRRRSRGR